MDKTEFDFDLWASLYDKDPEEFEKQRLKAIKHLIESAPADLKLNLERLQFRIDSIRKQAKNPMQSCIEIYSLMMEKFAGINGLNDALNNTSPTKVNRKTAKATIINLENKTKQ